MKRLNLVFPILVVVLMLSLFSCGGTSSTPSEGAFGTKWGAEGTGDGMFQYTVGIAVALFYWTCLSGYNSPQICVSKAKPI